MHRRTVRNARLLSLAFTTAFLCAAVLPAAGAQSQLNVKSVGEIFVTASGAASGQNVATTILETTGALEAFQSLSLGTKLFDSVSIDGFAQAEKIQGVGSSALLLRGSNAVVSVYDTINSPFRIQATAATTVRYDLSDDVRPKLDSDSRHVVDLHSTADGRYVGSVVLLGEAGEAAASDAFQFDGNGRLAASLSKGSQVAWYAKPVYVNAPDYTKAVVRAMADGLVASQIVTEFEGSSESRSEINYFAPVRSQTEAASAGGITTNVHSASRTSAVLAYDLAYESFAAQSADDVKVYADSKLVPRVESAHEIRSYAAAGLPAYYSFVANGRTQILASTPDFKEKTHHAISLVPRASSESHVQAQAEKRFTAESTSEGRYNLYEGGKAGGFFTTALLNPKEASIVGFTSLASRTEIFREVRIDGASAADVRSVTDSRLALQAPQADIHMIDDAYATLLVDSKSEADSTFRLAPGIRATQVSDSIVQLNGPNGFAGAMILAQAQAHAAAHSNAAVKPPSAPKIFLPDASTVRAHTTPDARLVFRSQSEASAFASESVASRAISQGQIGAQFLAGLSGEATTATHTGYLSGVNADVLSADRARYDLAYDAGTSGATAFLFDARGSALAAKSASDVTVLVNGKAATAVSSPKLALDGGSQARYHVERTLDGATRLLVNTGSAATAAKVTIESRLEHEARASSKMDAFGVFKSFYGGLSLGSFVSLRADQATGVINDFTMLSTGTEIFSSIAAGSSPFVGTATDGSSILLLENKEATLEFTDTTSAYMKAVAKAPTTVDFQLPSAVVAQPRSANVLELTSVGGADLGSMIITDVEGKAAHGSYFETSAPDALRAHLDQGAQMIFRTHVGIEHELSAAQRTMINHAIAAGNVAGQVMAISAPALAANAHAAANAKANLEATSIPSADTGGLISVAQAQGTVTQAITASYYNDVQMVTAATQDRVDVTVSSASSVGKTIIISLDPNTVSGMATGDAEILVDGEIASQASSYADILNAMDDAGVAEYFVLTGEAGSQVLVSIPHFSTRTVTLKEREAAAPPLFMYATIFLGLLVAVESVALVHMRRRA